MGGEISSVHQSLTVPYVDVDDDFEVDDDKERDGNNDFGLQEEVELVLCTVSRFLCRKCC